ncbi:MAG: putative collagen-binding domain-containing protein [Bryobacteraceae bacterium]
MNLRAMTPQRSLSSTGYLLASPEAAAAEYLVYAPSGGSFTVNLRKSAGAFAVEWLNPETGSVFYGDPATGGRVQTFTAPFSGDAVLYLHHAPLPRSMRWPITPSHSR